jgi:hypothetical protein
MSKSKWRPNAFQMWVLAAAAWWAVISTVWLNFIFHTRLVTLDDIVWLFAVLLAPPVCLIFALFVVPWLFHWTARQQRAAATSRATVLSPFASSGATRTHPVWPQTLHSMQTSWSGIEDSLVMLGNASAARNDP